MASHSHKHSHGHNTDDDRSTREPTDQPSWFNIGVTVLFYLTVSISSTYYNKWFLSSSPTRFQFPLCMIMIQQSFIFLFVLLTEKRLVSIAGRVKKDWQTCKWVMPIGLLSAAGWGISATALSYIPISLYAMIKSSGPLWVLSLSLGFALQKYHRLLVVAMAFIAVGTLIAATGGRKIDINTFPIFGVGLCLGGTVVSAFKSVFSQIVLQRMSHALKHDAINESRRTAGSMKWKRNPDKLSAITVVFFVAPTAALAMLPVTYLLEGPGILKWYTDHRDAHLHHVAAHSVSTESLTDVPPPAPMLNTSANSESMVHQRPTTPEEKTEDGPRQNLRILPGMSPLPANPDPHVVSKIALKAEDKDKKNDKDHGHSMKHPKEYENEKKHAHNENHRKEAKKDGKADSTMHNNATATLSVEDKIENGVSELMAAIDVTGVIALTIVQCVFGGMISFLNSLSGFMVTKKTSALTLVIISLCEKILTVVGSAVVLGEAIAVSSAMGFGFTLTGVGVYNYYKLTEGKAAQEAVKLAYALESGKNKAEVAATNRWKTILRKRSKQVHSAVMIARRTGYGLTKDHAVSLLNAMGGFVVIQNKVNRRSAQHYSLVDSQTDSSNSDTADDGVDGCTSPPTSPVMGGLMGGSHDPRPFSSALSFNNNYGSTHKTSSQSRQNSKS